MPVIKAEHRSSQPLSLIIYEAMLEAAEQGYKYWNWGGTWKSQDGVYRFKKRWNTQDKPYYYFTKVMNSELIALPRETIEEEYAGFYVLPFNSLKGASHG